MRNSVTISSTYNEELFPSPLRPDELAGVHGGAWNCADADGIVPEYYGVWPDTQAQGLYGIADVVSRNPCQRQIRYDVRNMSGAGPRDWAYVRAHERAHTRGWDHGAGTPATNPAYYSSGRLTGR